MADTDTPETGDDKKPTLDFVKMLDLNRSTLIKSFVDEMENRMHAIETAQADLKAITESAKEQEFSTREVHAMKKIAKLRMQDKKGDATAELAALERIGKAVEYDLFDFAGVG